MIKNVVGGFGNVVIFEIDDGLFAIVNVENETVAYSWYWLFLAKYEPIRCAEIMNGFVIDKARDIFKANGIGEEEKAELIEESKRDTKHMLRDQQDKLIEQSRRSKKGIYLR